MCVWGGGVGGQGAIFMFVVFNANFSNFEPICHFLAKQTEFGRIFFIDKIFNANIFI